MAVTTKETSGLQPHVGIIGAGISGLRCASLLLSRGFQVTLLEARDRIGGRICQSDQLGYTVDIGPNWIHAWTDSGEPHPIFKAAEDTNTPLHRWNNKQLILDSLGEAIPEDVSERLSTILWEIIEKAFNFSAQQSGDKDQPKIPSDESLYDFIRRETEDTVADGDERALLLQMSEMFGAYVGEPVWKQSLRFAWLEECCGGDEMFVASNYSKILGRISQPARENARILLETYVNSVSAPEARHHGGKVTVTSQGGATMAFDEVVVTTPLGWLKRNKQAFVPPLPPRISSAIDHISLSQLEKVFITFPSAFWNPDTSSDTFPCYVNWLHPEYATRTNPECWPQEIWDLSSFAPPNNHPTMLFYTYGDCARHIVNSIYGKSAEEEFQFLDDFFRPYYSRLPGFDENSEACKPKAILASKWLKDDLCGNASYCNFQVGVEEADKDILALQEGCPDRRLWFCGEHAAPFDECGTVAGAYLSGEAAAKKIVDLFAGDEKM